MFKKILPYLVAILVFIVLSMVYFSPALSGKKLTQSDIIHYTGSAKEVNDFRQQTGEEALWTNAMFGGMPAYQISVLHPGNIVYTLFKAVFLSVFPHPINILLLLCLGFFVLMLVLKVDPWLSMIGAVAFAFSTYFFLFLEVGHNAKALAIGMLPTLLAGMILVFRRKYLLGGALLALFMAIEISVNHVQMTYYMLFVLLFYGIAEFITSLKTKQIPHFLKATGVAIIAMLLAVGPSISNLWTSSEYMKETIRGGSELTNDQGNKTTGLDKDYITQWSYGIGETFTLMIPDAKGGGSQPIGKTSALDNVEPSYKGMVAQSSSYWGDLQFTSGPVYVGALICFLFILGLFIVRKPIKWVLFASTVLAIFLAWGHNMAWLTDFFIYYFPYYNKFRAVSSWMIIAELTMPILAILAVKEIIENPEALKSKPVYFYVSLALTAGIALLFWLIPTGFFDFINASDTAQVNEAIKQNTPANSDPAQVQQVKAYFDGYLDNLETARISIFKASALRSFLFIILGAAVLFFYIRKKLTSKAVVYAALGLLILTDLWMVNKKYLNDEDFADARHMETPYPLTPASEYILADKDLDYRVLNMTSGNFSMDASASFYHKSLGGYHAAKLRRYQDLIEHRLFPEQTQLINTLQNKPTDSLLLQTLSDLTAINMLNTRYIILNPETQPLRNPFALGCGWFVNEVKLVENPDEEIKGLDQLDPSQTALVEKRFTGQVQGYTGGRDSASRIVLREYKPNKLTYDVIGGKAPQLAVFSEIYYPYGWKAFIDGQEAPIFRTDYVLRGLVIPAGQHTVVFSFEPESYSKGTLISYIGSALLLVLILAALYMEWRKKARAGKTVEVKK